MSDSPHWNPHKFWEILESSGRSLRTFSRKLEGLSKLDLCHYYLWYTDLKNDVHPCYWEECHQYLTEDFSEDHSDDFSAWVVMQGMRFYEEVARHPERIQQYLDCFNISELERGQSASAWDLEVDRDEYRGFQCVDGIAVAIFRSRFGGWIDEYCFDECGRLREELEE